MAFFGEKKAAAVLKHALLRKYLPPFVGKTGQRSLRNRVAFVDGFAGEGRYEDGQEGSPAIAMAVANSMATTRNLECWFVEENRQRFALLQEVIAEEAGRCTVEARHGSVSEHLDEILAKVRGIPLLVFLDPFGLTVTFDEVVKVFNRAGGYGAPASEVLVNFSTVGLRRVAGLLTSRNPGPGAPKTLARMDAFCGGDWWRETWLDSVEDSERAEDAVISAYADRLSAKAGRGAGAWMVDVRERADHRTKYYLVFVSRHPDGLIVFGQTVSTALAEWRRTIMEAEFGDSGLLDVEDIFEDSEARLAAQWVDEIYRNLKRLLAEGKAFTISARYGDVFGTTVGLARETHLRQAWKRVFSEGLTSTDSKHGLIQKRIVPA